MRRWYSIFLVLPIVLSAFLAAELFFPRRTLSAFSEKDFEMLVLDAGHGGEDGGTLSVTGKKESDVNLAVTLKARDLAALFGIPTVLTRQEDASLQTSGGSLLQKKISDLKNRAALVNRIPMPLLVSIHQNHFPEEKYHGAQVFYADTAGSKELAERMQTSLRNALDSGNRRLCKKAQGVYLMDNVRCTAVLAECGFLSNRAEEERLHDEGYQKKIAMAVIAAVFTYRNEADCTDEI